MNPVTRKTIRLSPVWIIPAVAAIICISLFYDSYKNAGITVQLLLDNATGINAGKTKVMVRGVPVGTVDSLRPDLGQNKITANLTLDRQMEKMLVEDSIFWVVRPHLSASAITGLETIVSGSYINIQPGSSDIACRKFIAAKQQPPPPENTPGLHLTLIAKELGSLQTDSGIYYKNMQIGSVEQTRLVPEEDRVELQIIIQPAYEQLVKEGSRFCNASGIQMKWNISNVSLKIASLAALMRGGIELFTPEELVHTPFAKNHATFPLYVDFTAAEYGLPLTLHLDSSRGIVEGSTKVIYQGLVAGIVKKLEIPPDKNHGVTAHVQLDPRAKDILRENTRFWLEKPGISPAGVQNLQLFITGSYITFEPGKGKFKDHFTLLPSPPTQLPLQPGKLFHLQGKDNAPIVKGSPVHCKGICIGEVISVKLDRNNGNINTDVFIYQDYLYLVNSNSLFWVESGIETKASIASGFSLKTSPLGTMLFGGIALSSPVKGTPPVKDQNFTLYANHDAALARIPSSQSSGEIITITAERANSLTIGTPVLFRDIQIGKIKELSVAAKNGVIIKAIIHDQYRKLINRRSRFYNSSGVQVDAGIRGFNIKTDSLLSIAAGGIFCVNVPDMPPRAKNTPWRLYDSLEEIEEALNYFPITLRMPEAAGIKTGTTILYKGISIGEIQEVYFAKDMQAIIAHAKIEKKARQLFRKKTKIWVEQPQIKLGRIKHPKALVLGPDLAILPGKGELEKTFTLLNQPPYTEIANKNGMGIVLEASHLGSISIGSPLYYRQVQVGQVTGYRLSSSLQKVEIFVSINRRFQPLIRINTHFWNTSGIKMHGGLFSGVTLAAESLEAIVNGGIALATPNINKKQVSPPAKAGQHFPLYEKPDKNWLDWQPDMKIFEKEDAAAYLHSKR